MPKEVKRGDFLKTLIKDVLAVLKENGSLTTKKCSIRIKDDTIDFIGEIKGDEKADIVLDGKNRLAIPGLVNAHTHSYMTLFRNSADDMPFNDWLFGRILPMEDKLIPGDSYWSTLLGICEMLRSGTTAFLDMYIFPYETARAVSDSGIRAVISRGLVGETADDEGGLRRINEARQDFINFKDTAEGRLTFRLAPHAPYTCSPEFLGTVIETAKEMGVGIHTHLSESRSEVENIRSKYGMTPIALMQKTGLFTLKTAAAHCVHLDDEDFCILKENDVSVLTNPASNMKLGNGFAPVPRFLEEGINVALGTDSAASNNSLNLFKEINNLSLIHKGAREDAVSVSAAQAFTAATEGGARALDINCGELSVGKKADIVLLDLTRPQLNPPTNLIASLAYSADGSEVRTVIVNGRIVLDGGELRTIDEERVIFETNRIFDRINS